MGLSFTIASVPRQRSHSQVRPIILFFQVNTCDYSPYVTSSLRRGLGLSFTIASGPRQRSHSQVRPVILFFQLDTYGYSPYVTSFLTRGWICRLQLLLVLASAVILRSESRGTYAVSDSKLPNLEGQVPVYPPGRGCPGNPSGNRVSSCTNF
jgi:hypothetical protein